MDFDIQLPKYDAFPTALAAGQVVDWSHFYLKPQEVYDKTRGSGAIVGVIDTSGDFSDHPDLAANSRPQYDKTFTGEAKKDGHGHGTHCAGIIAAVDNEQGVIGVSPDVAIVALKALTNSGGGSFVWIAAAVRYFADLTLDTADAGRRKILSLSLGSGPGSVTPSVLDQAIRYAISKGVIIVVAAGNSGYNGTSSTVGAPGNHPLVITVASAMKPGDKRSSFSSGGSEVDVIAPGSGIYSTHKDGGYAYLSGTSMACPAVAGIVALLVSLYPELDTQAKVKAFLTANATDILATGRDNESGYGSPVILGYVGQDPDDDNPGDDDPGDDDPVDDEPDEPTLPNPPRRQNKVSASFPLRGMLYAAQWKLDGDNRVNLSIIRDLVVRVTSDVVTEDLALIVREYVAGYFAGRMVVLKPEHDLYEAGLWTGVFLQFIADDDWVLERFGVRLNLTVESLSISNNSGAEVTITQDEIKSRGDYESATITALNFSESLPRIVPV